LSPCPWPRTLPPSSPPAPEPAGRLKRAFIRFGIRFFLVCYLRVRRTGWAHIPADGAYLLVFNHPNWVDPFLITAYWPTNRPLFIFGPKEEDMSAGWRNRLIAWGRMAVPFKPSRSDLIDTTRRATAVLKRGYVLAIAGEGRLSDEEGELAPMQDGAAFIALRAQVPIVPLAIVGSRWLRLGKRISLRVGEPIPVSGRADRGSVARLTARLEAELTGLLADAPREGPPGPLGRWLTDVFNERPWLDQPGDRPPSG
jgi:1-acyl-sn-glycerol-3-phosphate acyltransferase